MCTDLLFRQRAIFHNTRQENDLDDELHFHQEIETQNRLTPEEPQKTR